MESTTNTTTTFTPCASLAALGCYVRQLDLWAPIGKLVQIKQKTVTHTPLDKLYDAWITILAGAHGLVEANTRLRSDLALQQAFGRTSCAEQSTIQQTLNACSAPNVTQLSDALTTIYRQHSRGYAHSYQDRHQLLDVDLSGLPCGGTAEHATKGYFAKTRNRRGRQLGRVLASHYSEIVLDQLFVGTTTLVTALRALVETAEVVLELSEAKRRRTIIRIDAGGGSVDEINWLLERGYQVHTKDYSRRRARKLGASVQHWIDDPHITGRQVGWVTLPTTEYRRDDVRRLAVRWLTKSDKWEYAVIISSLGPRDVLRETGQERALVLDHEAVTLAYVRFYDARGGGVETAIKDDKQGLGITKRNKKRFEAQQMVMLLGVLAHNVLVWARRWLAPHEPKVRNYGLKRLVRDVLHISGFLIFTPNGRLSGIVLNQRAPLARNLCRGFDLILRPSRIAVNWGKT
jgi:hypothetical protein